MKPSILILTVMSAALLASCQDKSKNDVKPQPATEQQGEQQNPDPPGNIPQGQCPACGMG